jgi:hypothetical protein
MKKAPDFEKLHQDYLDLCDSYKDEMPVYEFGFGMIRIVSKMLFDCAPSRETALETIRMGINEGLNWHIENGGGER